MTEICIRDCLQSISVTGIIIKSIKFIGLPTIRSNSVDVGCSTHSYVREWSPLVMDSSMDEMEQMLDASLTRNLIDSVTQPGCDVLNDCAVSLLLFPTRNAVLITCYHEDFIPPALYAKLLEIAKFVHQKYGRTHICLRHHQKQLVTRWDSEKLG